MVAIGVTTWWIVVVVVVGVVVVVVVVVPPFACLHSAIRNSSRFEERHRMRARSYSRMAEWRRKQPKPKGVTMKYLAAFLAAALSAGLITLFATGGKSDPEGDAYKTVVAFTTSLSKRNFYDACTYYSDDNLGSSRTVDPGYGEIRYSRLRWCAVSLEAGEGFSLTLFGLPVFDNFEVERVPSSARKAPKNGYVFKVTFYQGVVYISVQRDKNGDWKVVSVS